MVLAKVTHLSMYLPFHLQLLLSLLIYLASLSLQNIKDITGLTILKKINHQHTFQNGYEKVDCYDKTPSLSYDALLRQLGDGVLMLP